MGFLEVTAPAKPLASVRQLATYAAVITGAVLATLGPVADGDIYWHLAAGRLMRTTHALVSVEPFTQSAAGRSWVDVHWLFQIATSALFDRVGMLGLSWAAAFAVAATACLVVRTAENTGGREARDVAAVLLLAGLFAARHLIGLRPVLVTLLAMALGLAYLERWRCGRGGAVTRWLARLLPVVQLLWTNCQGLSYLGLALLGGYGLGEVLERRRRPPSSPRPSLRELGVVLGACALASLLTPYGVRAWLLPFSLLGRISPAPDNVFSLAVAENVPPLLLARATGEDPAHLLLALAIGLVGLGASLAWRRPRLAWGPALVLAGLVGLSLLANRNILLLYVLAPALLGPALAGPSSTTSLARIFGPVARRRVVSALGLACLCLAAVARAKEPPAGAPTPFRFPEEAARKLAAAHATGVAFAPDHQGGYLTFHVPGLKPYLDTRLVLHTADEYAAYLAVLDEPARFDELDARAHFDYVVLTTGLPGRYLGLTSHLLADPRWHLLATDGTEVLLGRAGDSLSLAKETTRSALCQSLERRFGGAPELREAAYLNLARLLIAAGEPDGARDVLAPLPSRAAAWLRARALFAGGSLAGAQSLTSLLLRQAPDDADGQALSASLHLAQGQDDEGRAALRRAVKLDPFNPEARELVARLGRGEAGGEGPR